MKKLWSMADVEEQIKGARTYNWWQATLVALTTFIVWTVSGWGAFSLWYMNYKTFAAVFAAAGIVGSIPFLFIVLAHVAKKQQ